MASRKNLKGRLELTWTGKDQALIPTSENTYDYTWVDPADPRACQTHYLIDEGHVGDPADGGIHDNLLITGESGDVLEALTRVPELAEKYVGRVKCVYIDPPFNTGGAFTHYEDNLEHSIWLTMMRDRLVLLKKLLADDGSIWVHLDDTENHRMRALMDEVFGAGNYVREVTWEKTYSPRNDAKRISNRTDTILVYRASAEWGPNRLPRTAAMDARYSNPDGDVRGLWTNDNPAAPGAATHQGMVYAIEQPITGELVYPAPGRCWTFGQDDLLEVMRQWSPQYELVDLSDSDERARLCGVPSSEVQAGVRGIVLTGDKDAARAQAIRRYQEGNWPLFWLTRGGRGGFRRKSYLSEMPGRTPENLWLHSEVGHTDGAKKEILRLFPGETPFATPKPERLIERVLTIATEPGDLVLDCFAGSGTTAAVAHKMGRRWVTCELLDETVNTFTRPRLEQVVGGEQGGVSTSTERVAVTDLPADVDPGEAKKFTSLLGQFADEVEIEVDLVKSTAAALRSAMKSDAPPLDEDEHRELQRLLRKAGAMPTDLAPEAVKQLRKAARTRDEVTVKWRGGGGFDVARLSPAWVEVEEIGGAVMSSLTQAATGEVLSRSVAAHLGFRLLDDSSRYVGQRGRQFLAVIEAVVTVDMVDELVAGLPEGGTVVVVCDGAEEGVHAALTKRARGSRVLTMPDDLFLTRSKKGA